MDAIISALKLLDTFYISHNSNILQSVHYSNNFPGVPVEDMPVVEEFFQRNIFKYDFDIHEGEYVGEIDRRII